MKDLQTPQLFDAFDKLQQIHGDKNLLSVYGAGCIKQPKLFLLFMNPTGRNVSCIPWWKWIHAPRLGTKNIWKLFASIWAISEKTFGQIQNMKPADRTEEISLKIYQEIASNGVYISNLAKCTQADARPLKDSVFKEYLSLIREEIECIEPQHIITFGNQVSSIVLEKKVTVSSYTKDDYQILKIKDHKYKVYPTFYPVGQGMRNLPHAIERIKYIIAPDRE